MKPISILRRLKAYGFKFWLFKTKAIKIFLLFLVSFLIFFYANQVYFNEKRQNVEPLTVDDLQKRLCIDRTECRLLPKFFSASLGHYLTAPTYNLSMCIIFKNFSTVLRVIMCYFYDAESFRQNDNGTVEINWEKRNDCRGKNEFFGDLGEKAMRFSWNARHEKLHRFSATRHPIERFLSGFLDKCIYDLVRRPEENENRERPCNGCDRNITCFAEYLYGELLIKIGGGKSRLVLLEYAHFAPQTWWCNFEESLSQYKLFDYSPSRAKDFLDELFAEFAILGVPTEDHEDIKKRVLSQNTKHTTFDSPERKAYLQQIDNDLPLKRLLILLYYHDFLTFKYEMPQI